MAAPSTSSPSALTTAKGGATSAPKASAAPTLPPAPPGAALRRHEGKCFIVEHLGGGPEPAPWRESEVQCPPDAPP